MFQTRGKVSHSITFFYLLFFFWYSVYNARSKQIKFTVFFNTAPSQKARLEKLLNNETEKFIELLHEIR